MKGTVDGLRTLIQAGAIGSLPDDVLLDRFVATSEPAAFEVLVGRHGPMVWRVCRRILRDHHDADDAFQATFLVLARRADVVRPGDRLVAWLYGVACRTALKARAIRARRRLREVQGDAHEPWTTPTDPRGMLVETLDRELIRLPEKYRMPIVLCDLEGCSHREAADRLGCPIGTLSGRHSRARSLLADRLRRRGVTLSTAAWLALAAEEASAVAPIPKAFACAGGATAVPAAVALLTREVQGGLLMTKIKTSAAVLLMVAAAGVGVAGFAQGQPGQPTAKPTAPTPIAPRTGDGDYLLRTYYVGDILGADGSIPDGRAITDADFIALAGLITRTIAPETWEQGGQAGPQIKPLPLNLSMLIRQDRSTHDRIGRLLTGLRRLQAARLDAPPALLPPAPPTPTMPSPPGFVSSVDGAPPSRLAANPQPPVSPIVPATELVNRSYEIGELLGIAPGPVEDQDAIPDPAWPLLELIAAKVESQSWVTQGGRGTLRPYFAHVVKSSPEGGHEVDPNRPLMVTVRQTAEVQRQVKEFLDGLRRVNEARKAVPSPSDPR
ncbi:RNA polymerase sigma factor [Paludisphaera rhizosphaerae]|uniref:RNA polymerase sigma factor n=1 Tax=Paludisphaera rhizosphaerae TaxID=2711216 RepID=UPI0013ED2532|nr:sigma-70 family RNA polymerase sigma factor [Paludisphaera rhizosphaerae]